MTSIQQLHFPGIIPGKIIPKHKREKSFIGKSKVGSVLLLGGGVQSTCLAYMMHAGVIDPVDLIIFSDTQDEPWWVYQTVGQIASKLAEINIPVERRIRSCWGAMHISAAGQPRASMPLWIKPIDGGRKPGRLRRQCTTELKIKTGEKGMKEFLLRKGLIKLAEGYEYTRNKSTVTSWELRLNGAKIWEEIEWPRINVPRDIFIDTLYGITTDEQMRAKERGAAWQRTRYPLIEMGMSRDDCIQWIKEHGYPMPMKSACVMCPYRSDSSWLWMKTNHPEEFEKAVRYDSHLRSEAIKRFGPYSKIRGEMYLHKSCLPLADVPFIKLVGEKQGRTEVSQFELEILVSCESDGGSVCMS